MFVQEHIANHSTKLQSFFLQIQDAVYHFVLSTTDEDLYFFLLGEEKYKTYEKFRTFTISWCNL